MNELLAGKMPPPKAPVNTTVQGLTEAAAREMVLAEFTNTLGRSAADAGTDSIGITYWVSRLSSGLTLAEFRAHLMARTSTLCVACIARFSNVTPTTPKWLTGLNSIESGAKTREQVRADIQHFCDVHVNNECR